MEVYLPHRPKGMDGGLPYQDMYNREAMQGMGEHLLQKSCNAEVIVSNQAPYRIKAANDAWVNMLGFSAAQAAGRSLGLVQGPATDGMTLNSLIKHAALGTSQCAVLAIYTRSGRSILMRVSVAPMAADFIRILMIPSDAVPVKMAMQDDDGLPKVVLSATAPHIVQSVSTAFSELYGINSHHIIGRSLHLIHGPRTDMRVWTAMVKGALQGQTQCDAMYTCACDCTEFIVDVTVTPASGHEGIISHLICTFSLPHPVPQNNLMYHGHTFSTYSNNSDVYSMSAQPHFDYQMQMQPSRCPSGGQQQQYDIMNSVQEHSEMEEGSINPANAHRWMEGDAQQQQASSAVSSLHAAAVGGHESSMSYSSSFGATETTMRNLRLSEDNPWGSGGAAHQNSQQHEARVLVSVAHSPNPDIVGMSPDSESGDGTFSAIFPRRKAGQEKKECHGPVVITLDVLESMADAPLSDAAKKLGVSSTAIKKACRKLGVQRWPYRKRNEGVQQTELLSHYNEAYVRKLFRKYSPKVSKAGKGKAVFAFACATPEDIKEGDEGSVQEEVVVAVSKAEAGVSHGPAQARQQPQRLSQGQPPPGGELDWSKALTGTDIDSTSWIMSSMTSEGILPQEDEASSHSWMRC